MSPLADHKVGQHASTLLTYGREARTPRDFWRVLRVRLSQSKLGPVVCRRPIAVDVNLRSLGRVRLRSHTSDVVVLGELIEGGSYEPLAAAAGEPVRTIVDLGANTGLAARWLLGRFPGARIAAVEPEDGNLSVLRRNLEPIGSAAHVVGACIGATPRRVVMVGAREDGFRMSDDSDGTTDVVTMEHVLETLEADRVDLLKVDIEGAEEELFDHCGGWIHRVGVVSVECHHPFTADSLLERLERHGAQPEALSIERTPLGYDMALVRIGARV
ncbi:FkbM family methyltransferase [Solirubrobacter sp. CPCC 204708]|uniref:FkbM family methyltransferase n=1 Tax=Solirubrobacter deserti TaxID=2282478 RepID=A0ABT4RIN6_9ACTN|nr:FkbM family methyltransferase [Solirubrobacter deserti]MBE2320237.1 FkbM family methyltransferase [Solirubrobacter deserti]MDA0138377.1 FkbM family methyltransferase [Solirubrobacter deserti]